MSNIDKTYGTTETFVRRIQLRDSQCSINRAVCLKNYLRRYEGSHVTLEYYRKPKNRIVVGNDSNVSSRQGLFVNTERSPRGFIIDGWELHPVPKEPECDPGPRKGVLQRRQVPRSEDRLYYPNIIREDKEQQKFLEENRDIAIAVMS